MNPGGGGEKPFAKSFAKPAIRIFVEPFLGCSRASYGELNIPSRLMDGFGKAFPGFGKASTKPFPKVSLDVSPTYAPGVEAARHLDCRQGIEQPAAQYAASRAHAGLQLRRARQLEAFHGEDVPSTTT
jgi:hypothetical protein